MFLESILMVFFILFLLYSIFMGVYLGTFDNIYFRITFLDNIFNFVCNLFKGRNLLGYILSTVVLFLSLPSFVLHILICFTLFLGELLCKLWELGKIKTDI